VTARARISPETTTVAGITHQNVFRRRLAIISTVAPRCRAWEKKNEYMTRPARPRAHTDRARQSERNRVTGESGDAFHSCLGSPTSHFAEDCPSWTTHSSGFTHVMEFHPSVALPCVHPPMLPRNSRCATRRRTVHTHTRIQTRHVLHTIIPVFTCNSSSDTTGSCVCACPLMHQ
jgi:hypothetical protein